MNYRSTRGTEKSVPSHYAIKNGIAEDGGLYVPEQIPSIAMNEILNMADMPYFERAAFILKYFLTDFTEEEILNCTRKAYSQDKFDCEEIAPVHKLNDQDYILELWHGPTCAFKDMALQILPHLLTESIRKSGDKREVVILTATSGDTGKAALEGFKNVNGTKIVVFFPKSSVSDIQKLQMITQEGNNTLVIAIEGNFDDAQSGVKSIFGDEALKEELDRRGYTFSSANSINLGRLAPQIVYYFSGYVDMVKKGYIKSGESINVAVPTGNFGNILAAFYAKQMGLPLSKLICASNENNVLTDFINTGRYDRNRDFKATISPSMDILISSNLERLLYHITDNKENVKKYMNELGSNGHYNVSKGEIANIKQTFWSDSCSDEETKSIINHVYKTFNYVLDTHTAVGLGVLQNYKSTTLDATKTLIASTASPFKFSESVLSSIKDNVGELSPYEYLEILSREFGLTIPSGLVNIDKRTVIHNKECKSDEMKKVLKEFLAL